MASALSRIDLGMPRSGRGHDLAEDRPGVAHLGRLLRLGLTRWPRRGTTKRTRQTRRENGCSRKTLLTDERRLSHRSAKTHGLPESDAPSRQDRAASRETPPARPPAETPRRSRPATDRRTPGPLPSQTSAQTLPPNPAPNADAATAPSSRADAASAIVSGTWLRSRRSASHCDRSASAPKRARSPATRAHRRRPGPARALLDELLEARLQHLRGESAHGCSFHDVAHLRDRRRSPRLPRTMRLPARRLPARHRGWRSDGERRPVVGFPGRARLLRDDAAHRHDEHVPGRRRHLPLVANRAERVLAQLARATAQHRRVVLAAAKRPDTAVASQRPETLPVLHRAR